MTGLAAFTGGTLSLWDAVDCSLCGCQNILCERKPKAGADDDETETEDAEPESGLNALAADIHNNAAAHGWWDEKRTLPEILMLCVSELAEALELYRDDMPALYFLRDEADEKVVTTDFSKHEGQKPQGVAVELADTIIRVLDYCGHEDIDIDSAIRMKHEYNKSRPYRHGGKRA
jgi:NTP pyrophosphatase (non-canonical NTP hydrolase)